MGVASTGVIKAGLISEGCVLPEGIGQVPLSPMGVVGGKRDGEGSEFRMGRTQQS